jgi:hypothetical protein
MEYINPSYVQQSYVSTTCFISNVITTISYSSIKSENFYCCIIMLYYSFKNVPNCIKVDTKKILCIRRINISCM